MSVLWVICGAGRGVGKTHLARGLCSVLPNSTRAKLGHGRRDPDGPPNYFRTQRELAAFLRTAQHAHEHIILESNAHARRKAGDIIIFVDAIPGETGVRDDAAEIRGNSHIRIAPGARASEWRDVLRANLGDDDLCRAVENALGEQVRYVSRRPLSVRSKVWFVAGERRAFGPGLARLLEGVERLGTLREAADAADMSYRYAWSLIDAAERRLGDKLLTRHAGGHGGGRSELADQGRHLLDVFRQVSEETARFADERFAFHYGEGTEQ